MSRDYSREKLQDVVPLTCPLMVSIEPTNICNLKCRFCPTGCGLPECGKRGFMDWNFYLHAAESIKQLGSPKMIGWFMVGESLLHPRLCDMVRHAKEIGLGKQHRLITNGLLITTKRIPDLVSCGLDIISISLEGLSSEEYERVAGRKINYSLFKETLTELYANRGKCHIDIKLVDVGLTENDKKQFRDEFGPISDELRLEGLFALRSDLKDFTLGTPAPTTLNGFPVSNKVCCPYPFFEANVRWNGKVVACCADFANNNIIGDLHTESMSEIWNGEKMNLLRKMQLNGTRFSNIACGNCGLVNCHPDNIDDYRDVIRDRMYPAS